MEPKTHGFPHGFSNERLIQSWRAKRSRIESFNSFCKFKVMIWYLMASLMVWQISINFFYQEITLTQIQSDFLSNGWILQQYFPLVFCLQFCVWQIPNVSSIVISVRGCSQVWWRFCTLATALLRAPACCWATMARGGLGCWQSWKMEKMHEDYILLTCKRNSLQALLVMETLED